jgi:hypothetical protein
MTAFGIRRTGEDRRSRKRCGCGRPLRHNGSCLPASKAAARRRDEATVACAACGRVVRARKNGHPYRHTPKTRLRGAGHVEQGYCDGSAYAGAKP